MVVKGKSSQNTEHVVNNASAGRLSRSFHLWLKPLSYFSLFFSVIIDAYMDKSGRFTHNSEGRYAPIAGKLAKIWCKIQLWHILMLNMIYAHTGHCLQICVQSFVFNIQDIICHLIYFTYTFLCVSFHCFRCTCEYDTNLWSSPWPTIWKYCDLYLQ